MLTVENIKVTGFEEAIRGARNSFESWDKSDSVFKENGYWCLGPHDVDLLKRLVLTGCDAESKFARYIIFSADITAPLYWWKEMDTYKVGTVANSTSTMHSIQKHEFTYDMFSTEHLWERSKPLFDDILYKLNEYRQMYLELSDPAMHNPAMQKEVWWQMIQLLPTSFNQRRTVLLNYQNLRNIWVQRRFHKLDEWHQFIEYIRQLPYCEDLIMCLGLKTVDDNELRKAVDDNGNR